MSDTTGSKAMKKLFGICALLLAAATGWSQLASSHQAALATGPMSKTTVQVSGRPVARVNGAVLTDRDLLRKMNILFPYAAQHGGAFPKGMEEDIRHGAMKMIVFEELCYQDAQRRGYTVAPLRVDKAFKEVKSGFQSKAEYQQFLDTQVGGTEAGLRSALRRTMMIQDYMKREIADKSVVTVAQQRLYYQKNSDKFRDPELVSFQTISVLPPKGSSADMRTEARKRAESALKQAQATTTYEQFGLLAEKISEDDFRVNMGDRHSVPLVKCPDAIARALKTMQPGQVSGMVEIDGGYTILRLNSHMQPRLKKFEEIHTQLKESLHAQNVEKFRAALDDTLRKKAKVEEL
jgi:parvulin-like peptidyl-prolyl isomerase